MLGALLADHPEVDYIFEPWHLWAAINPLTDANCLYESTAGRVLMDDSLWDPAQTRGFEALIRRRRRGARLVVEKSPVNALRIGWLEALAPGARYINLLRDGGQVAQSISLICNRPPYRVGRKRVIDQWWGLDHAKWRALAADGAAAGYCPDEVALLSSGYQRGAYEWLVSVAEVERLRPALGERVLDVRLDRLCAEPADVMRELADFLGLSVQRSWVDRGVAAVGPLLSRTLPPLLLPPAMARSFNERQAELGFPTRAEAATGEAL